MRRREFLYALGASGAALITAQSLAAQEAAPPQATSNLFEMDQAAARRVQRPSRPGASASMNDDQRDALEHDIRCQCGCTLDVYTCRTTDFACQVSPAMHRDVVTLVENGYSAQEIIDAFVDTYGERVLMAPRKEGFNWAGYLVPFAALGAGAAGLAVALRRMQQRGMRPSASRVASAPRAVPANADEMARLDAAVRRDD